MEFEDQCIKIKAPICPMNDERGYMNVVEYRIGSGIWDWQFFIGEEATMLFACKECGCVVAKEVSKLEKVAE